MHSGPVQPPSGIAYEKVQMGVHRCSSDVIAFYALPWFWQAFTPLKADYEAFTFNTADELSRSYWLQYEERGERLADTVWRLRGFFGSNDAKTA